MKKLALLFLLLMWACRSFGQLSAQGFADGVVVLELGGHQTFMDNAAFDNWTRTYYNHALNQTINGEGDLAFFTKKFDGGLHLSASGRYTFVTFYAGLRLTPLYSSISSYLNIGIGGLIFSSNKLAPVDYTPTPDQVGQKLKLQYDMTYLSLTSKNYLNDLHFHFGKHKKTSFNAGFYVTAGYDPFSDRKWKYGYDDNANATTDDDGNTSTPFNSVDIHNIPLMNRFFMEVGVFAGIGN